MPCMSRIVLCISVISIAARLDTANSDIISTHSAIQKTLWPAKCMGENESHKNEIAMVVSSFGVGRQGAPNTPHTV